MKILQRTNIKLVLRSRPIGVWILAAIIAAVGMSFILASAWPTFLFGGVWIIGANLALFFALIETCTFNQSLNKVVIQQRGWLGRKTVEGLISQIADVQVEERLFWGTSFYRVTLVMRSGVRLPLSQFPTTDRNKQQELAGYIKRFLRLYPVQQRAWLTAASA